MKIANQNRKFAFETKHKRLKFAIFLILSVLENYELESREHLSGYI